MSFAACDSYTVLQQLKLNNCLEQLLQVGCGLSCSEEEKEEER